MQSEDKLPGTTEPATATVALDQKAQVAEQIRVPVKPGQTVVPVLEPEITPNNQLGVTAQVTVEQPRPVDLKDMIARSAGMATTGAATFGSAGTITMDTYACTVSDLYPEGSAGYEDLTARQTLFIRASSVADAQAQMKRDFPMFENFTASVM